jgi:flagellar biosynthesis GTPase FlhF
MRFFHKVAVDGSSAYLPRTEENFDDDLDANEGFVPSPMSTNTQKRGSGSFELRSTASSPSKRSKTSKSTASSPRTHGKTKGPFVKYIKDIETKLEKEVEKTDSILQALVNQGNEKARRSEERAKSVAKCQNLAIECGAAEELVEYFVACDLFKEKHNRYVFQNIKTPEARLTWLKRWCREKNMYEADGGI